MIPIVTLVLPFAFVILILWLANNEKHKRNQLRADLYTKALEKGQPIPPDLFAEPKKDNPLHTGITMIFIGIGITIFMWLVVDSASQFKLASVGLIPFFIGIAFLIIHFLGKKQSKDENSQ